MTLLPGIYGFYDKFDFLSNFYPSEFVYRGLLSKTVEHAYQAEKSCTHDDFIHVMAANTPASAKSRGRDIDMRDDWDEVKDAVMLELLRKKFEIPALAEKLLDTDDLYLEETNHWYDRYWGVCNGKGLNHLGLLLMKVREELRSR